MTPEDLIAPPNLLPLQNTTKAHQAFSDSMDFYLSYADRIPLQPPISLLEALYLVEIKDQYALALSCFVLVIILSIALAISLFYLNNASKRLTAATESISQLSATYRQQLTQQQILRAALQRRDRLQNQFAIARNFSLADYNAWLDSTWKEYAYSTLELIRLVRPLRIADYRNRISILSPTYSQLPAHLRQQLLQKEDFLPVTSKDDSDGIF